MAEPEASTVGDSGGSTRPTNDERLLAGLRRGDEDAFRALVDEYGPFLMRLALMHVRSRAIAEEVVQDTWLAVLNGIDRFEGRSSLRTWIFRILVNRAKTRGVRERRVVPFSSLADAEDDDDATVDADRFVPRGAGRWVAEPARWSDLPEERLLARETLEAAQRAIEALPPNQRAVITLRDVEGWEADEVRDLLDISDVNQRVLLHRARAKVRRALERELGA